MSTPDKPSSPRSVSAQKILNPLKRMIASPYGIAAIASLSFHGVMFAAAPRFSAASFEGFSEGNGEEVDRTVPLVALTPAEQGRLPNFNRPSLPTIPDISSSTTLRTLPNATTLTRPNLPRPGITTPRLPSSSSSSIFNRSGSRTNRSSIGSLNRSRSYNNPYNLSTINPPTRSNRSSSSRTTSPSNIPAPPGDIGLRLGNERGRDLEAELEVERQAAAAAAAAGETETEATNHQGELAPGLPELPPQSESGSDPETSDPDSEDVAINDPEIANREPTQLERLQANFKYDPAGTSEEEANQEYLAWAPPPVDNSAAEGETADEPEGETDGEAAGETEVSEPEGSTDAGEIPTATAEFGVIELQALSLCVDTPPNDGMVGILVAPDGTPDEPIMFRSTGYDYLNQQAIDTILQTDFPATESSVRYPFDVVVNYDAETCQSSADIINTAQNN